MLFMVELTNENSNFTTNDGNHIVMYEFFNVFFTYEDDDYVANQPKKEATFGVCVLGRRITITALFGKCFDVDGKPLSHKDAKKFMRENNIPKTLIF